ncbi:MAG TPA: dihydrofolate reductase family protein [Polyangia bacterium]|nr:dihydrofolate reductase family protein [Polyangia bacterium]
MRTLTVFNSVSIDGYFTDDKGDMSWAHRSDPEWMAFSSENAGGGGELLFGRVTYELMRSHWPTAQAAKDAPKVAEGMNRLPKVVFSRTLEKADWQNTRVVKGDLVAAVRRLKEEEGPPLVLMGSGTIVSQLTRARLVDEYQVVLVPIVVGRGRTMFEGIEGKVNLKLKKSRPFKNGNVVLWYEPGT